MLISYLVHISFLFSLKLPFQEADLGLLQHPILAVNCYHKAIHLRCCSSPRSDSDSNIFMNSTFNKRHPTSSCVRCNCIFAAFLQFLYVFLDLLFLCLSICSLNKLDQNSYSEDFGKPWLFFVAHVKL